jgi:hypothetical protein
MTTSASIQVGRFQTFGEVGPLYRVIEVLEQAGRRMVRIELPETGETLTLPEAAIANDPVAK